MKFRNAAPRKERVDFHLLQLERFSIRCRSSAVVLGRYTSLLPTPLLSYPGTGSRSRFPVTHLESLDQKPKHPWISLVDFHAYRGFYHCFLLFCASFHRGLHYTCSLIPEAVEFLSNFCPLFRVSSLLPRG